MTLHIGTEYNRVSLGGVRDLEGVFHNNAADGFRFRAALGALPTIRFLGTVRDLNSVIQCLLKIALCIYLPILGNMGRHFKIGSAVVWANMQNNFVIHDFYPLSTAQSSKTCF